MFLVLESIVHCSKYAVVRGGNLGHGMIEPSRHDVVESHDDARKAWILERGEQSLL